MTCPFCTPRADLVFHRGELVLGIWDAFPVAPGHALLITRRHVESWFDATPEERAELMAATDIARRSTGTWASEVQEASVRRPGA